MSNKIPVIWQFSVVQFELGTTISGVVLSKIKPSTYPERFLRHQASAVIRSYTNKPYACKELFIMADKKIYTVTTTKHGNFNLWLKGDRTSSVEVYTEAGCDLAVPRIQLYPFYHPLEKQNVEIISDIDDTIVHSFSNTFLRRVFTILFKPPQSRKMVDFTRTLLIKARESGIRVYCISRSEMNLFYLLTNIFSLNHISGAIIRLFDYLNYPGLLVAKEKKFKFEQIASILQLSPGKQYCLIGDDTQNDIRIYSEIAEQFKGRICSVLIHKTKSYNSRFQKFYYERLVKMNIPVLYFSDGTPFDASIIKIINP